MVIIIQCILPAEGFFFKKKDTRPVEEQLKEHGILVKEVYPIAAGGGGSCTHGMLDLLPLVEGRPLRASLQDVFDDLSVAGKTPEETQRLIRKREIVEAVLNDQEKEFEEEIDFKLSTVWNKEGKKNTLKDMNVSDHTAASRPLTVTYNIPQSLTATFFKHSIREEQLSTEITERLFVERLKQMIGQYRDHFMEMVKRILHDVVKRRPIPWDLLTTEHLEEYLDYRYLKYNQSLYKEYPNETLFLVTIGSLFPPVVSRISKYQLEIRICHPFYSAEESKSKKLYRIETVPRLVGGYYAQSILPELIAIKDSDLNTASKIADWRHKGFFVGRKFVGDTHELPYDCNIYIRKGCQYVLTPKKKFEAENPDKIQKVAADSSAQARMTNPKVDF